MSHTPTVQAPPWFALEQRAGCNLHAQIEQRGRSDLALTKYRLGEPFHCLARDAIPMNTRSKPSGFVTGIARTWEGEWRIAATCPTCSSHHVHPAGMALTPRFGLHRPSCGCASYWLDFNIWTSQPPMRFG